MSFLQISKDTGASGGSRVTETTSEEGSSTGAEREASFDADGFQEVSLIDDPEAGTLAEQMGDGADAVDLVQDAKGFDVADAVSGVVGVVAGAASAVVLGFQIKKDFDDDQPAGVKAMVGPRYQ